MAHNTLFKTGRVVCCEAVGYVSGLRDVARAAPHQTTRPTLNRVLCATCCNHLYSLELLMMGIIMPETFLADYKFNKPLCSV